MTREEFNHQALNPPKAEGKSVFVVTEIDLLALPDNRKNRYPKFPVYRRVIGYGDSLGEAEILMRRAISQFYDIDEIY